MDIIYHILAKVAIVNLEIIGNFFRRASIENMPLLCFTFYPTWAVSKKNIIFDKIIYKLI